jgi:NADH dehydrogenase
MDARRMARVVILGGGFAGVATAQELARRFRRQPAVEITLVNRESAFVYGPLLVPASVGSIDIQHTLTPLRGMLAGVHCRIEEVVRIDLEERVVHTVSTASGAESELPFDHLVITLGASISLSNLPGVAQNGRAMLTVGDALGIRNHVLRLLEAADVESDPAARHEMLTFVIAGGSLSAVAMAGELSDMLRDVIGDYPSIARDQIKIVLLPSEGPILQECPSLTGVATAELEKRGVEVRLGAALAGAMPNEAILASGKRIPTRTLVVMDEDAPPPVLERLDLEKLGGRILVDEFLRVPGLAGVWAAGDNAVHPRPGPRTTQHAVQQGKTLAWNIAATLDGTQLKPFAFVGRPQCLVGRRSAVVVLPLGIELSGLLGWFLWRRQYRAKSRGITQVSTTRTHVFGSAHYEAGEYVFRQGEPADRVYVVTSGEVEVVRELPSGEEEIVARMADGEFFGENALIAHRRRNASVRCVTPANVLAFEPGEFDGLTDVRQLPRSSMQRSSSGGGAGPQSLNGDAAKHMAAARLVRSSTGEDLVLNLNLDIVSLGRGPQNHIVVADPAVSSRHALIQREGEAYWVEDLASPNGVLVNRRRLTERTRLKHGDLLRLGSTEFTFELSARESARPARPVMDASATRVGTAPRIGRLLLEVCAGPSVGETFDVDERGGTIGRANNHLISLPDASLSRDHARVDFHDGSYWLTDLHSTNGTSVNEQRLSEPHHLKSGDSIDLGKTRLIVSVREVGVE